MRKFMKAAASASPGRVRPRPQDGGAAAHKISAADAGVLQARIYFLENLGCAHCAAKMEERIGALAGVAQATLTFATKQLKVTAVSPEALLPDIRKICASIEANVKVLEKRPQEGGHSDAAGGAGQKRRLGEIVLGAGLFLWGQFYPGLADGFALGLFIAAYAALGGRIVWSAARNILRGQVFDENFLMSIATLGAFAIREYPEAVGVMLFFRIGAYFEQRAVERSRSQIMRAADLRPETVLRLGDAGEAIEIAAEAARAGDIVRVRPGDRVPLDGVVTAGESRLDTSPVTGEPAPVGIAPGSAIISGCVNLSGTIELRVEKVLAESMVTRILRSVEEAAAGKPKIDRFITRFARVYTPVVVAVAAVTAIVPSLLTGEWEHWIYTALTFLVISCPCALVLSVPLAFFSGIGAGSKRGILFKGGAALEALKNVRAVVMDKTGTLTKGDFSVQEIRALTMSEEALLRLCASGESGSAHPIAHSIVQAARDRGLALSTPLALEEIAGKGIRAKLAEGEVLCGNRALLAMFGAAPEAKDSSAASWGTEVFVALNGVTVGSLRLSDTIKAEAAQSVAALKRQGIAAAMLTGDAAESAAAVAAAVGIEEVRAKLLPEEKLVALKELRERYGSVMFVGDGINDAPVLAGADVGAAMGGGADAAIEAADVVFMTAKVDAVAEAIAIARATSAIAWQNVGAALAIKALVMGLGLFGYASMWLAVFADTGVAMLCVLNAVRILYKNPSCEMPAKIDTAASAPGGA